MNKLPWLLFLFASVFVHAGLAQVNPGEHDSLLDTAIRHGAIEEVKAIIAAGVDVNARDGYGRSPLEVAIYDHQVVIAVVLIDHGANPNTITREGYPVLNIAIGIGNRYPREYFDVIRALITHGADVNGANEEGATPLMAAATTGQYDVAALLIAHGADIQAKASMDGHGWTAYDIAASLDRKQIMDLLVQHGAEFLPNLGLPAGSRLHFQPGSAAGTVFLIGDPAAAAYGEQVTVVNIRNRRSVTGTVKQDGGFQIRVPGSLTDEFSVQLSGNNGQQGAPVYLHGSDPALNVTVISPSAGTEIQADNIIVSGTYAGPLNTGITVNGEPAMLYNGRFVANHVELKRGANTIKIAASTQGGLKLEQTVRVTSAGTTALILNARSGSSGVAPLTVTFLYEFMLSTPIKTLQMSYLGNGKNDLSTSNAPVIEDNAILASDQPAAFALKHTYKVPGIYPATLTVVDAEGVAHHARLMVVVLAPEQMDQLFNSVWRDMTTALLSGNQDAVLNTLDYTAWKNLGPALKTLIQSKADFPGLASPLLRSSISNSEAEYVVVRTSHGKRAVFFVYFVLGSDGVWRIDSM